MDCRLFNYTDSHTRLTVQVYGAVTMINTLVLGVLLGVLAVQHIRWRYSGELIIALLPTLLVGSIGASSRWVAGGINRGKQQVGGRGVV